MKQKAKITFTKSEIAALWSASCYFDALMAQPAMIANAEALERAYKKIGEHSNL